jgi:hypothetical protein
MSLADNFRDIIRAKEFKPNLNYDPLLSKTYYEAGHLYFHLYYDMWYEFVTLPKDEDSKEGIHQLDLECKKESGWVWWEKDEKSKKYYQN